MNLKKVKKALIYGIDVYTIKTDQQIPYQLSFERDLFHDRVNVHLIPLISPEKKICPDLRQLVCNCFLDYMKDNPDESLYFDIDVSNRKGELTLIKFLRWAEKYNADFEVEFNFTHTPAIRYMEIYIRSKI